MALSFLVSKPDLRPTPRDEEGAWVYFDGNLRILGVSRDEHNITSRHMHKQKNPHTGAGRQSTATPPYHYHKYETDILTVNSGVLCYVLDGKESKARAGDTVFIHPGVKHTFWSDPDSEEGLDMNLTTVRSGNRPGTDECFLHNVFGYIDSMRLQNKTPSMLQLLAFMDAANTVVCEIPFGLGWLFNIVFGRWLAQYILGYQASYKVYSERAAE